MPCEVYKAPSPGQAVCAGDIPSKWLTESGSEAVQSAVEKEELPEAPDKTGLCVNIKLKQHGTNYVSLHSRSG